MTTIDPPDRAFDLITTRERRPPVAARGIPYARATDATLAAILATATVTFAIDPETSGAALGHGALLVAWIATALALRHRLLARFASTVRPIAAVALVLLLYTTLAEPAFVAMGGTRDALLAQIETALFGGSIPAFAIAPLATPVVVESFSFIYGWFIPLLYISIFLGCFGRPREETSEFLFGFVLTYSLAYLGYLFVPARGPIVFYEFASTLPDGFFHRLVVSGIDSLGGPHGAFPSLHLGATLYVCLYDLRRNRLRGLTLVPIVLGIAIATILLRYHYVIDLIAGALIASLAAWAATRDPILDARRFPRLRLSAPGAPLRVLLAPGLRTFFRRIEIEGLENVPAAGPLLLVANHLNGLVDPLIILQATPRWITLTAKATLRSNPLLALAFRVLRIVPFERKQDAAGAVDPARNEESIERCARLLTAGRAIAIFPEGVSHSNAQMRPLKTGAARIALRHAAEESTEPLAIVPVGLHFEQKEQFRSAVLVRFGPPVMLHEWTAANPGGDARALTETLEQSLRSETLNFEKRRQAILFASAAALVEAAARPPAPLGREHPLSDRFAVTRALHALYDAARDAAAPRVEALIERIRQVNRTLRRTDLKAAEVFLPPSFMRVAYFLVREVELLLFGLPVAAIGAVQHGLGWMAARGIARRFSHDRDHWASFSILPGMILFPLLWIAETATIAAFLGAGVATAFAIALPFTGPYTVLWSERIPSGWRRATAFIRLRSRASLRERLRSEISDIAREIEELAHLASGRAPKEQR